MHTTLPSIVRRFDLLLGGPRALSTVPLTVLEASRLSVADVCSIKLQVKVLKFHSEFGSAPRVAQRGKSEHARRNEAAEQRAYTPVRVCKLLRIARTARAGA